MNSMNERVFDKKSLFFYLLNRWKVILIFMLTGGIALAGLAYVKTSLENRVIPEKEGISEVESRLTEEELAIVMDAVNDYMYFDEQNEYMKSNVLMMVDARKMQSKRIQYLVVLNNEVEYSREVKQEIINNILSSYALYVSSGQFAEEVSKEIGGIVLPRDISLLAGISVNTAQEYGTNFSVYINTLDQINELDGLEEAVLKSIDNFTSNTSEMIASHSLCKVNEFEGILYYDSVYNRQQSLRNEIKNYRARIDTAKATFSADQMKYYNYLIGENEEMLNTEKDTEPQASVKNFILGMCLGLLGIMFVLFTKYMLSGVIVSSLDYNTMFSIPFMGTIFENITSLSAVQKLEYGEIPSDEEAMAFIALKIKRACDLLDIRQLAMLSSNYGNIPDKIMRDLQNLLKEEQIELIKVDKPLLNGTAMGRLFEIGNCIIIEKKGDSKIAGIRDIVELCNENDVHIVGVVDICEGQSLK